MRRLGAKSAASALNSNVCSAIRLCSTPSTSLAAGLFRVKVVPKEMFPYPVRVFTADEGDNLETIVRNVQEKRMNTASKDLIDWGLPGASIPAEYGGLQLSETAHSVAVEEISQHTTGDSFQSFLDHIGVCSHLIKACGSSAIRATYLSGMSDATIRMGWAVNEIGCGCDVSMNTATATPQGDGSYLVRGTKIVHAGNEATHFLVMAKAPTQVATEAGPVMEDKTAFFIVDKKSKGVTVSGGMNGTSYTVTFNDALAADLVGVVGEGHVHYMVTLHSCHHLYSAAFLGLIKRTIALAQSEAKIANSAIMKALVSSAVVELYGLESAVFALTANLDLPVQDSLIEATVSASLVQKQAKETIERLLSALEGSCVKEHPHIPQIRCDLTNLVRVSAPAEFLNAAAACCGVEDFGLYFQKASTLETMQNRILRSIGVRDRVPGSANWPELQLIEDAVLKLGAAVEHVFVRQNVRLRFNHLTLNRISECVGLVHAACATASRIQMAEKKGVEGVKTEKKIASLFIQKAMARTEFVADECKHSGKTADESFKRIATDRCEVAFRSEGGNPASVSVETKPAEPVPSEKASPVNDAAEAKN